MKNWLDKYEYGGQAGYTDIPFNYNSAWGGQFQLGGNVMPGAVGFTYARTGSIPSNGPYAKKTKASAQTGETVSQKDSTYQTLPEVVVNSTTDPEVEQARKSMFDFYSNRPTNLSGDIASEAVENVNIEEIPIKRLQKLNAYGLYYPSTNTIGYNNQTVTPEGYSEDPYNEVQTLKHEIGHSVYESLPKNEQQIIKESIISPKEFRNRWNKGEISRSWSKYVTKPTEFYTRRNRLFDMFEIDPSQPISDEKAQEMIDFRKWAGQGIPPEEKEALLKKHPNFNKYKENFDRSANKPEIVDFINAIKNDVPTYKRVFNEVTAVPGEQAPIAQNGMTYYQHGLDWKPKSISKNGSDIPKNQNAKYTIPDARDIARSMMNKTDVPVTIQEKQRKEAKAEEINRRNKATAKRQFVGPARAQTIDEQKINEQRKRNYASQHPYSVYNEETGNLERRQWDRDMEGVADKYTTAAGIDKGMEHFTNALEAAGYAEGLGYLGKAGYNALRSGLASSMESGLLSNASKINPFAGTFEGESSLPKFLQLNKLDDPNAYWRLTKDAENYGLGKGAYFNKGVPLTGDLANTFPKGSRAWTHRYSGPKWNPETGKIDLYNGPDYLFKVEDEKFMEPHLNFPDSHLKFFRQSQEVPQGSSQLFKKDWLRGWKPTQQKKQGGIIKDDRGQWAHPGEVTEIGSNQITMQGVPYPVLGVSDQGDTQMMFPEQEYKFKGKKVTEIPMAQRGKELPPRVYTDYDAYTEAFKSYADSADAYNANQLLLAPLLKKKFKIDTNEWNDFSKKIKDPKTGKNVPVSKFNKGYYNILDKSKVSSPFRNVKLKPTKFIQLTRSSSDRPIFGDEYGSMFSSGNDYWYAPQYNQPQPIIFVPKKEQLRQTQKQTTAKTKPNQNIPKGWIPLTPEYAKGRYSGSLKNMYYNPTGSSMGGSAITYFAPPPKVDKPEPTLKKKLSNVEPIHSSLNYTPQINTIQHPNIELPDIQMGDYDVSYYSPESKDWANRRFTSQEESDRFAQEMSQRGYPGSYGNVTQTKKLNKKSTGGWLDKYN